MGRGSSKAGGGGGGGGISIPITPQIQPQPQPQPTQPAQATTASGVTYDQFMQMNEDQRYQTINNIIADQNIVVPSYLDSSQTSKVIYALGMNNKPTVVSESQLDAMQGREIYRTVYDPNVPKMTTADVLDQVRNGEYTQMSGQYSSAHSRALYFATKFTDSTVYGHGYHDPMVMRAKINPNANIRSERSLYNQMSSDSTWATRTNGKGINYKDELSLYAIAHGVDGWYSNTYTMLVNRGAITASSQNRRIGARNVKSGNVTQVSSWNAAAIVP